MDYDEMLSCAKNLGFELLSIDNQDVLYMSIENIDEYGMYALLTDMEGLIPQTTDEPIIWSIYDENDSFQWSVTIENFNYLAQLFEAADDLEEIINSLKSLREDNILESESYI